MAYWFTGEINPRYAPWIALIVAMLAPGLVVSLLRFNLSNTSYRNLRFRFAGGVSDGLRALWPLPIVALLTLAFPPVFDPTDITKFDWKMLLLTLLLSALYPICMVRFVCCCSTTRDLAARRSRVRHVFVPSTIYLRGLLVGIGLMLLAALLSALIFGAIFSAWAGKLTAKAKWLPVLLGLVAALPSAFAAFCGLPSPRPASSTPPST